MKNGTENIWIFLSTKISCINSNTVMLCCVHPDGDKFNNYFSVVQDAGRCVRVCVCVWGGGQHRV